MINRNYKTCFGMALIDNMNFKTLGGSIVNIKFDYKLLDDFSPIFHIKAIVTYAINDTLYCTGYRHAETTLHEAKYPAGIVKELQKRMVAEIINEVFDKEVA